MAKERISEKQLVLPSLYLMKYNGGTITTTELIDKLRLIMKPPGEDLSILTGRNDDKFSQKVRNLKSHEKLSKLGYAEYVSSGRNSFFKITKEGAKHLEENSEVLRYLLINDFSYETLLESLNEIENKDKNRKVEAFDENIIVNEGLKKVTSNSVYERSTLLRNRAIEYFTDNNKICCSCCQFDFEDFYGDKGKGFIEIHHIKPIFKYEDVELNKTLEEALANLAPVCSNCHRMIHRNWSKPLEIRNLIDLIDSNGTFKRFQ